MHIFWFSAEPVAGCWSQLAAYQNSGTKKDRAFNISTRKAPVIQGINVLSRAYHEDVLRSLTDELVGEAGDICEPSQPHKAAVGESLLKGQLHMADILRNFSGPVYGQTSLYCSSVDRRSQ